MMMEIDHREMAQILLRIERLDGRLQQLGEVAERDIGDQILDGTLKALRDQILAIYEVEERGETVVSMPEIPVPVEILREILARLGKLTLQGDTVEKSDRPLSAILDLLRSHVLSLEIIEEARGRRPPPHLN